jgi:hypothetical protein
MLISHKHPSLLDPFGSYAKNSVVNTYPEVIYTTLHFLHDLLVRPNKLVCSIKQGCKCFSKRNTLAY